MSARLFARVGAVVLFLAGLWAAPALAEDWRPASQSAESASLFGVDVASIQGSGARFTAEVVLVFGDTLTGSDVADHDYQVMTAEFDCTSATYSIRRIAAFTLGGKRVAEEGGSTPETIDQGSTMWMVKTMVCDGATPAQSFSDIASFVKAARQYMRGDTAA